MSRTYWKKIETTFKTLITNSSWNQWSSVCFPSFGSGFSEIVTGNFSRNLFLCKNTKLIPGINEKERNQFRFFNFLVIVFSIVCNSNIIADCEWKDNEKDFSHTKRKARKLGWRFLHTNIHIKLIHNNKFHFDSFAKWVNKFSTLAREIIYIQFHVQKGSMACNIL